MFVMISLVVIVVTTVIVGLVAVSRRNTSMRRRVAGWVREPEMWRLVCFNEFRIYAVVGTERCKFTYRQFVQVLALGQIIPGPKYWWVEGLNDNGPGWADIGWADLKRRYWQLEKIDKSWATIVDTCLMKYLVEVGHEGEEVTREDVIWAVLELMQYRGVDQLRASQDLSKINEQLFETRHTIRSDEIVAIRNQVVRMAADHFSCQLEPN
jgi:hypothetical protein